ncbi:MAG TPA: sulfur oxidation c-type cytochrome SoxX [Burkholderiales bacterium]|nr:sulfur oxidation c-type cytochrome SoxX [Burkholderiales bacterium]
MKPGIIALAALCAMVLFGCATRASDAEAERGALAMMKTSFKAQGQAGLDRLDQDEVQALCSKYPNGLPKNLAEKLEKAQLATIRYPASGKLIGDWREGERIAQSGVGKQFNDDPKRPSGGNCYACHRLSPQELSFGTIGPSLYQFGKLRGSSEAIQKYAYGKVYNAEAFSACSNMPRFGHNRILTEEQIMHLVALLLDPDSPVNK